MPGIWPRQSSLSSALAFVPAKFSFYTFSLNGGVEHVSSLVLPFAWFPPASSDRCLQMTTARTNPSRPGATLPQLPCVRGRWRKSTTSSWQIYPVKKDNLRYCSLPVRVPILTQCALDRLSRLFWPWETLIGLRHAPRLFDCFTEPSPSLTRTMTIWTEIQIQL